MSIRLGSILAPHLGLGGAGGEATFGSFSAHRKLRLKMAKPGALVAAAAALVAIARAQQASQCTPQYLAQVQALCCDDGRGNDVCNGGQPSRCNGNCATMFLDFYDNCELQGQDRDMDALATTCRSTVRRP